MSKRAVLDAADALLGRSKEAFSAPMLQHISEEIRAERIFSKEKQESVSPLEDPIFEHKSQQWKEAFQRKLQSDPQGGMGLLSQEKALLLKAQEQSRIQKFVQDYTLKEKHLDDLKFLSQTEETQHKRPRLSDPSSLILPRALNLCCPQRSGTFPGNSSEI